MAKANAAQNTMQDETVEKTEKLAFNHLKTLMTEMMQMEDFPSALVVASSAMQQYDNVAVATARQGGDKNMQRGSAAIAVIHHMGMLRGELLKNGSNRTH